MCRSALFIILQILFTNEELVVLSFDVLYPQHFNIDNKVLTVADFIPLSLVLFVHV